MGNSWLRRSAILLVLGVLTWLGSSCLVAYKLSHRRQAVFPQPPPRGSLHFSEPLKLTSSDGLSLCAWLWQPPRPTCSVLLLHGNGASRAHMRGLAELVSRWGCRALALSFRAHGDSEGDLNDFGYSAAKDVQAGLTYLKRFPEPILVIGHSLGAAATMFALADHPEGVGAVILESPYYDLRSATRYRTEMFLPEPLSSLAYYGLLLWAPLILPANIDDIAPFRAAPQLKGLPCWYLAGTTDIRAPASDIKTLAKLSGSEARYIEFPGAGHSQLWSKNPALYRQSIQQALAIVRGTQTSTRSAE